MKIFATEFASFKPSYENPGEAPKLPYVDTLFKRRLSQISRMTIDVIHSLIGENGENSDVKIVFSSFRGEIARQLKTNRTLFDDAAVMPASFSISVFNAPPGLATIVCKMKAGYTAIFPGDGKFSSSLTAACAGILCGDEKKVIFAYADELVPEEYKSSPGYVRPHPLAFACVLSAERREGASEIPVGEKEFFKIASSPEAFLAYLESSQGA